MQVFPDMCDVEFMWGVIRDFYRTKRASRCKKCTQLVYTLFKKHHKVSPYTSAQLRREIQILVSLSLSINSLKILQKRTKLTYGYNFQKSFQVNYDDSMKISPRRDTFIASSACATTSRSLSFQTQQLLVPKSGAKICDQCDQLSLFLHLDDNFSSLWLVHVLGQSRAWANLASGFPRFRPVTNASFAVWSAQLNIWVIYHLYE